MRKGSPLPAQAKLGALRRCLRLASARGIPPSRHSLDLNWVEGESPDLILLVPWRLEKGGNVLLAVHPFLILEGQTKENLKYF